MIYMSTRIKEIMASKGFTNVSLGEKMGVSKQAVGQMLKAESLTTASLEKIAVALDVPIWQLFASPEEVSNVPPHETNTDFVAFVRYRGIHYTADTLEEFLKQVEEIKTIAR
jgi:transcriptional regulator with XRE-family HTH domain